MSLVMLPFLSSEIRRYPFPLYQTARAASPLHRDEHTGIWMAFTYDAVKRILHDNEFFSSAVTEGLTAKWLVFLDEPRHSKLRALVTQAFTPKMLASLEPRIFDISRKLLARSGEGGEMDLVADYAVPLPMMVIAGMLGVPSEDWPRFRHWSDVILNLSLTIPGGERGRSAAQEFHPVSDEMRSYLAALLDERRERPTSDMLTRLLYAQVDRDRLSTDEILAFLQLLIVAGHETTTNLIANAVLCLSANPDQLKLLRHDPQLLEGAIEEVLRYRSPVQWVMRVARRQVDVEGVSVSAGAMVLPMLGSANHDERVFEKAEEFSISRTPNPHIAFGHGIHFCIGAALSRLEARIALPMLLAHLGNFEVENLLDWTPREALHVHGPSNLKVRFGLSVQKATN